ncbi:acyltransferase-domain-containing protein, partial [Cunninghamella echinulata]
MGFSLKEIIACSTVSIILMFQAAIVCFASPVIFICIRPFSKRLYRKQLADILSYWSQNLIGILQWLAPSQMVFYFDESCPPSSLLKPHYQQGKKSTRPGSSSFNPSNEFNFPERTIFIANHQIYADWMYIWFIAYLAKAHGSLKIMLKNSLKYLPFFGQGMQLLDFIFMKRKLINDKKTIIHNLERSKKGNWPMWLVLFPEGTGK